MILGLIAGLAIIVGEPRLSLGSIPVLLLEPPDQVSCRLTNALLCWVHLGHASALGVDLVYVVRILFRVLLSVVSIKGFPSKDNVLEIGLPHHLLRVLAQLLLSSTGEGADLLPAIKEGEGGHGADLVALGELLRLRIVHVHLDEDRPVLPNLLGQPLVRRCDLPAGAAAIRIKVHDNRQSRLPSVFPQEPVELFWDRGGGRRVRGSRNVRSLENSNRIHFEILERIVIEHFQLNTAMTQVRLAWHLKV